MSGALDRGKITVADGGAATELPDLHNGRTYVRFDDSSEIAFLSELVRTLPTGLTVQDEQGNFVLVNDAAAAQFNVSARDIIGAGSGEALRSKEWNDRGDLAVAILKSGQTRVTEELVRTDVGGKGPSHDA